MSARAATPTMTGQREAGAPVVLLDPGDFTPAYDFALQAGLSRIGVPNLHVGKCGFDEMEPVGARWDLFYPMADRLGGGRLVKGFEHAVGLARLTARLVHLEPRVVHMQWAPLPPVDRLFLPLLRMRAPLVITAHDSNPYNGNGSALMKLGYGGLLGRADAVIVHTRQARARLLQAGVRSDRLHILPHGLLHPPRDATGPARAPGGRIRLLQLGKIKPYKGVDLLLEALGRLSADERSRFELHVAGKPYMDMAPLEGLIERHGLQDCVRLELGFLDEARMEELLDKADAALFAYREIDASGVALSAVSRGLPILASAIGGFAEMFEDGDGAELVPMGDVDAIAGVLRRWAADPSRLDELRRRMCRRRDAIPGWDEIAARTVDVYERAARNWRGENRSPRVLPEGS
ncbi:MAG: glycosyltransferase [Geminicoccaceae bacterium]